MEVEITGIDITAKFLLDVTPNTAANTSTVKISKVYIKSRFTDAIGSCWVKGSIKIEGTTAATLVLNNTQGCGVSLTGGNYGEVGTSGFSSTAVTVPHNTDGTKTITITSDLTVTAAAGGREVGTVRKSGTAQLTEIKRPSTISASGVTLGNSMTVSIGRKSSSFTDTITWSCGSKSGTIATKTSNASVSWTPPVSLATENTTGTSVSVKLTVTTYNGSQSVGSNETTVSCTIPASVVPTASITVSDKTGYKDRFGGYIQNQSQARVETTANGIHGSTVSSIAVKCGSLSSTGSDVTFSLPGSGNVSISVTVTDSRGRTATVTSYITVTAYSAPSVTITDLYRCDQDGNRKPDGGYAAVEFRASVSSLSSKNTAEYSYVKKVHGGTAQDTGTFPENSYSVSLTKVISANVDNSYEFTIRAKDFFQTQSSRTLILPVAFALMDFNRSAQSIGFGMRAGNQKQLEIGMDTDRNEHQMKNLGAPTESGDAVSMGSNRFAGYIVSGQSIKDCILNRAPAGLSFWYCTEASERTNRWGNAVSMCIIFKPYSDGHLGVAAVISGNGKIYIGQLGEDTSRDFTWTTK